MCTYRDNAMDRTGELPPDFRTAVEIEWSKGKTMNEGISKPLENSSAAEVAPQDSAAVRGEAIAECLMCNGSGLVGSAPDDYFDCPDCAKARHASMLQTWPENIWLQWSPDDLEEYPGMSEDLTWCADNIHKSDVHYVRADLAPVSARAADAPSEPSDAAMPNGLPPISASTYGSKTVCELEQLRRTQRVAPDNLPRWIDNMKGGDPTIDSLIEYIVWQSRAADVLDSQPTDLGPRFVAEPKGLSADILTAMYKGFADGYSVEHAHFDVMELIDSRASAAPVAPDGWKLVPMTITEDMHKAAVRTIIHATGNDDFPRSVWAAMLKAAPQQEGSEAGNG